MEAARIPDVGPARELSGDKAARIVEAMSVSVAARGIAGATFDHVAREAGVSRGLLHYYFGTKERLLVEVVRRECDVRKDRISAALVGAEGGDHVLTALVSTFEDFLGEGPTTPIMFYELITLAQQNDEIAAELREYARRTRRHLATELGAKQQAGVIGLRADPEAAADFLFALADGVTMRRLMEPAHDIEPLMVLAVAAARSVFT
ncbi:MAG TPA: TetR family transcriptional regulator [Solirubrobacteraceae bacterium]|nr:TetR family transcriptional regulator [Solirubrobacteraceae bacterium]